MKILLPISLIIVSILMYFFFVDKFHTEVKLFKSDVDTYNKALDNSTNLQKERDALLSKYRNISQEDKDRLQKFLPDTVNNIKFILEIEQMANLHGMPIKDIKFEDNKNKDLTKTNKNTVVGAKPLSTKSYDVFPVEFITEGKYDSFVLFLKDLETNLRLMDIKSISFNVPEPADKPAEGFDPDVYTYKLDVDTYWLK